jgi:transcriptional regulator GlxA family with amidase domain
VRTSARTVALLLFPEVELLDVASIAQILSMAGRQWNWRPFRVVPVSKEPGLVETRSQIEVASATSFDACPLPEILIVPGGYGARRAAYDAETVAFAARVGADATHLVAVGSGIGVLAAAQLLDGVRVAVSADAQPWIGELGPSARLDVDAKLVRDGRVATAARSGRAVDLALTLVEAVLGEKQLRPILAELGLPPTRETGPAKSQPPVEIRDADES